MNVLELRPTSGTLDGHVFENPRAGVPRGLYWKMTGDFAPIEHDGSEWPALVSVDWLTFDIRRWTELHGVDRARIHKPELVEASVYFMEIFQPAELVSLELRRINGVRFEAAVALSCELEMLDGTPLPRSTIAWRGPVELEGIVIERSNLFPKPSSRDEAIAVLDAFIDPADFSIPSGDDERFVFTPRESAE